MGGEAFFASPFFSEVNPVPGRLLNAVALGLLSL